MIKMFILVAMLGNYDYRDAGVTSQSIGYFKTLEECQSAWDTLKSGVYSVHGACLPVWINKPQEK